METLLRINTGEDLPFSHFKVDTPEMLEKLKLLRDKYSTMFGCKFKINRYAVTPKGLIKV